MAPESRTQPASAIDVKEVRIWFNLPFGILKPAFSGSQDGWRDALQAPSKDQEHYFHSFVNGALFGVGGHKPRIERWENLHLKGMTVEAQKYVAANGGASGETHSFRGKILSVEMRSHKAVDASPDDPGLGILSVGVAVTGVSKALELGSNDPFPEKCDMTLADAQNALDWMRRAFARWPPATRPVDGAQRPYIPGDMISHLRLPDSKQFSTWQSVNAPFETAPWVASLLKPWVLDDVSAFYFGDERAFMTSAILLRDASQNATLARKALLSVSPGDLSRLAEADNAGSGLPYREEFVNDLLKQYRYDRHAPSRDAKSGNSTIVLIAHHHICLIGAGKYMHDTEGFDPRPILFAHTDDYYRHLQLLGIYEYFRLIIFSQRLSALVRGRHQSKRHRFGEGLLKLRQDFLDFNHLHHFSNVSHQLQPREMYSQLYHTLELPERFAEVEAELATATDFAIAQQEAAATHRAERLNNLVAIGIPLSLIVGAAGSNVILGQPADATAPPSSAQMWRHLALFTGAISSIWAILLFVFALFSKGKRGWTVTQGLIWVLIAGLIEWQLQPGLIASGLELLQIPERE